jgi:SprB repeat
VNITGDFAAPSLAVSSVTATINCTTPTTSITASGADTFEWSGPNSFASALSNPTFSAGGVYTVIGTSTANGCTASATIEITENKIVPTVTVTPTNISCFQGTNGAAIANVTGGTTPYTYAWTGAGGFTATTNPVSGLGAGAYTVIVTGANGCTASATTILTQPTSAVTATATSNAPLCSGSNLNLTSTGLGGTGTLAYAWSGPNAFTASTQNASLPNAITSASGTYTITVTDANGCSANATANVIINPAVTSTPIPSGTAFTIVTGSNINLTATGCTGGTVQWYDAANAPVTMPATVISATTFYAKCAETANGITCYGPQSANVVVSVGATGVVISIKTGNWNDGSTWSTGVVPVASDVVTIDSGHIVSITNANAVAKKVMFNTNSTLNYANTTAKLSLVP